MKIICIGRNYVDHAKELNNPLPSEPLIFMKPTTALLLDNKPFYFPSFTNNLHYEAEIVLRISKNGRHVEKEFAHSYYNAVGFGIDFTARDLQDQLKSKGHPWEIAKGFDFSAPLSKFIRIDDLPSRHKIRFSLKKNGVPAQQGDTSELIFSFEDLICYVSRFFRLQIGDYIFTGTPAGVGAVQIGDVLKGSIEDREMLTCEIK